MNIPICLLQGSFLLMKFYRAFHYLFIILKILVDRLAQQKISGSWPTRITRWKGFLAEVDRYNFDEIERLERPHFLVITSTLVWKSNIFGVLNKVMKNYKFAKQKDSNFSLDSDIGPFTPVYTCRLRIDNTFSKQILAIEIKRSYYRIFQGSLILI